MQLTIDVVIDIDRSGLLEIFEDPAQMKEWQPTLLSYELLEGKHAHVGARARIIHRMGPTTVQMMETVTQRELPNLFAAHYEGRGVSNDVINRFSALSPTRTRWQLETRFRFSGITWLVAKLMPATFEKETRATMHRLKAYAESRTQTTTSKRG